MSEEEYQSLIQKQGLHNFVVVMSTQSLRTASTQDIWLRSVIGVLGAIAAAGLALAWRNVVKSSDLQLRLLRASELNNHLKEMNVAVAGLAHETRNPLNIIRGLAQMISKQTDASLEVRQKTGAITEEVDRVTAQLNEFIHYSKPRELRRAPVAPATVIGEVVRALESDLESKEIRLTLTKDEFTVDADEQLLRQALFNLVLNAMLTFGIYPITLFDSYAKLILFTIIPAALMGAIPAEFIRAFTWQTLGQLLLGAIGFLTLAILLFHAGLRRYESGSAIQIEV
jgi:signal transduction histidine kinase